MPKMTEGKIAELKLKIRRALLRDPHATWKIMGKVIGVDRKYAGKLMEEVRLENAAYMKEEIAKLKLGTVEEELIKMEEEVKELVIELWKIIGSGVDKRSKAAAIRTMVLIRKDLFNLKFDAGLFTRKVGELGITMKDLIKTVKKNVEPDKDPSSATG